MDLKRVRANLPWELIIEIFSRLPVKLLLRFRSVSKSCNSLFTEPCFIKKHIYHSTQHQNGVTLSPTVKFHRQLVLCTLSSLSHTPIEDAVNLVYPMKNKSSCGILCDSCDGLFCIEIYGDGNRLFLWNPSTRQSKRLQYPPSGIPVTYALGFDSLNGDYKVLRVAQRGYSREKKIRGNMYSLNTNSWTKLNRFPQSSFVVPSHCKYMNWSFHWLTIASNKIVSLSLSTERFEEVPLPNYQILQNPYQKVVVDFTVLRGMLCVYCNYLEHSFVLWLMNEYGDQESWEKIFEIPCDIFYMPNTMTRLYYYFVPMYLYENGEILLEADIGEGNALVTYNKNKYEFKKVVARGIDRINEAHVYVESLISTLARRNL